MTLNMKMILLSLALLTVGFEVAYGGKLPKNLDKTKGQGGLERINENWLGFNNSTKWVMRKLRKMIKAFDILEEQLVDVNETMVADMVDMNNTLVSYDSRLMDVQNNIGVIQNDINSNTAHINNNTMDIGNNTLDIGTNANKIDSNKAHIDNNAVDIGNNTLDIGTNANKIDSNKAHIDNNAVDIGDVGNDIVSQGSRLLDLETGESGSGSVWFDAERTNSIEASGWTKMTYLYVKESNAGAMDVGTGVFTAPLAGTYQFMLQVYNDNNSFGSVKIMFEGTMVSYIHDGDTSNRQTITGTAIVVMHPGQKVWAETFSKLYGYIHFTGVLITPK